MPEAPTSTSSISTRSRMHLTEGPFICKIIELVFCIIAMGLAIEPFRHLAYNYSDHVGIFLVVVSGYILINAMLILGYLLNERLSKKLALIFTTTGMILCFSTGVVLICDWAAMRDSASSNELIAYYSNKIAAAGFFAVFAAMVFAIDIYYIIRYSEE